MWLIHQELWLSYVATILQKFSEKDQIKFHKIKTHHHKETIYISFCYAKPAFKMLFHLLCFWQYKTTLGTIFIPIFLSAGHVQIVLNFPSHPNLLLAVLEAALLNRDPEAVLGESLFLFALSVTNKKSTYRGICITHWCFNNYVFLLVLLAEWHTVVAEMFLGDLTSHEEFSYFYRSQEFHPSS